MLPPKGLARRILESREVWEWQTVGRNNSTGEYVVALASAAASSKPFDSHDVTADVCRSGYQVGLNPSGTGTLVRMSTHLNAHLFLPFLWGSVEEGAVLDHAEALIEEALRISKERVAGNLQELDGGILAMLSTPPVGANETITVEGILAKVRDGEEWVPDFALLNVPAALNTSAGTSFDVLSQRAFDLFTVLAQNATASENATFGAQAPDAISLMLQGTVLAQLQTRYEVQYWDQKCNSTLPPINNNGNEAGQALWQLCLEAAAALILVIGLFCFICISFWKRKFCFKRLRARNARVVLQGDCAADPLAGDEPVEVRLPMDVPSK